MAAASILALSVAVVVLGRLSVSYPVAGSSVAALFGGLAAILILYRLVDPPGPSGIEREFGAWLGLAAAAAVAVGGYLGIQEPSPARHGHGPGQPAS